MDTKANIKELICNDLKASFEAYAFPDPNNVSHNDFYNWAESDPAVDTFHTGVWFFSTTGGLPYLTSNQKTVVLNYLQTVADTHNIPFHSSVSLDDTQVQNMVFALMRTLKDRNIDIKQNYINTFRSAT